MRGIAPELRTELAALVDSDGSLLPDGLSCYCDGSFCPAGQASAAAAGWSCVFFDKAHRTCDVLSGSLPAWCLQDKQTLSAFKAECCALAVAFWLGAATAHGVPLHVYTDCRAALAIANGEAATELAGIATVLGHVALCCKEVARSSLVASHVPGHSGVLGNEVADLAAKVTKGAALGWTQWRPCAAVDWWAKQGSLWSWAGLVTGWAHGDDAVPSPIADTISVGRHDGTCSASDLVAPFLPETGAVPSGSSPGAMALRFATYNALSWLRIAKAHRKRALLLSRLDQLCLLGSWKRREWSAPLDRKPAPLRVKSTPGRTSASALGASRVTLGSSYGFGRATPLSLSQTSQDITLSLSRKPSSSYSVTQGA